MINTVHRRITRDGSVTDVTLDSIWQIAAVNLTAFSDPL